MHTIANIAYWIPIDFVKINTDRIAAILKYSNQPDDSSLKKMNKSTQPYMIAINGSGE